MVEVKPKTAVYIKTSSAGELNAVMDKLDAPLKKCGTAVSAQQLTDCIMESQQVP